MKSSCFISFLLFILFSCSSHTIIIPPPKNQEAGMKTPTLILPDDSDKTMIAAATVFSQYANSDEFYAYVKKEVQGLEGGNETNVDVAIHKFRTCLAEREPIKIVWKKYSSKNVGRVIGGWRKTYLAQNPFKELNVIDRASHWIHEISHACGFTHVENDIMKYPVIKRSWPYQVGFKFHDFLETKAL
jgi:hypothetical protein